MKRLHYLLERDHNSLDFIRFCAAIAVIFTHAFPYALGIDHQYDDPLKTLTSGVYTFGQLAVIVFFSISGFLVTASMDRSQNPLAYLKARFLRIYPGLLGVVLVTIFIVGPLFTNLSLNDYFRSTQTSGYFNMLLLPYDPSLYTLPGVFTNNAYAGLLNGSLWTLRYEVICYGLVLGLWCLRLWRKRAMVGVWLIVVAANFFSKELNPTFNPTDPFLQSVHAFMNDPIIWTLLWLAPSFISGMVFYFYRDRIPLRGSVVLLGIPLLLISIILLQGKGLADLWFPTFGVYTLYYLATTPPSPFKRFGKHGDFSFGLYIYAPLVHQSMTYLFGGVMQPLVNFVLTAGITLVPAILSWHLVEKPALSLKNRSLRRQTNAAHPVTART